MTMDPSMPDRTSASSASSASSTPIVPITRVDADVAIVGSGFAGSLTALCLLRRGKRVVMVERGRHPRFAIGESSTPLANLLIEELADRYDLPRIRPFSKWGTWQRARPDVRLRVEARLQLLLPSSRRTVC